MGIDLRHENYLLCGSDSHTHFNMCTAPTWPQYNYDVGIQYAFSLKLGYLDDTLEAGFIYWAMGGPIISYLMT